ncbi:hypothetical protein PBI_CHE8_96 [Mycobacterium phage Che8]|uniref:Uncharacterized protein n=1 Tax=Mycobacterium virus Che8 TaxID=205868 RepID=Q855B4_9CAUD|nr:hypothetical protein PBI_CHE8_96 [Mycobacterium phage Che8]AAN12494.1 hypothetical protein PBI_CHE8_96 [Mycobacterium phage Che8]
MPKPPETPTEHIEFAREEARTGAYESAQTHALIAIAQLLAEKDQQ